MQKQARIVADHDTMLTETKSNIKLMVSFRADPSISFGILLSHSFPHRLFHLPTLS